MIRRRRGVSLIELLVVFAIIGVMMSLLLPAIFSAFESANRLQCQNNWYQIRLGGFVNASDLPYNPDNHPLAPYSALVLATAGIEQGWLFDAYNFEHTFDSMPNETVKRKRPSMFTCPNSLGGDRTRTTFSFDLLVEKKIVNHKETNVMTFIGCEVSPAYAYIWTDPRGYDLSIVDAIKDNDGRGAFFRNHGEGHFLNAAVIKANGGNPTGGGMEFNSDDGLAIRAWRKALKLDEQQ
jgi:prepilin-type N-terminal cleavage/methylation domain-containing protein